MTNSFLLLMMLLPIPARFALALPLFVLFNLLVVTGTGFNWLLVRFHLEKVHSFATVFFLFFVTILFKQVLVFSMPVISLVLSLPIFVTLFCAMEVGGLLNISDFLAVPLKTLVIQKFLGNLAFSATALFAVLVREVLAYQSISFPSAGGMTEFSFVSSDLHPFAVFWASFPGCLVFAALLFAAASFVVCNAGAGHD